MILGRSYQPTRIPHSSERSLSKSWLSGNTEVEAPSPNKGFNRLRESDASMLGMQKHWLHNVAVSGGADGQNEIAMTEGNRMSHYNLPKESIRVKTTITITERLDWMSDLY